MYVYIYIYIYAYIYIYIYIYIGREICVYGVIVIVITIVIVIVIVTICCKVLWLRTNGVSTNGAAAEVASFDGLGKKVRPGTFENKQVD